MPARSRTGSASSAPSGDPTIRTQLPAAIPITAEEIRFLDQLFGAEIARLFTGGKNEEV
jgi:hypothetical protein